MTTTLVMVPSLVTVMLETLLTFPLLVAVTMPEPPAHFGMKLPITRPLALTVMLPVVAQVVVVPQQLVLQATVLPSLIVAVTFNWTVASSAMVAVAGAITMLETVLLVMVMVEILLLRSLLVA